MTSPEFTAEFQSLMQSAMSARVPIGHLVLTLEMAKVELGFLHCVSMQRQQDHSIAQKMANDMPKIIKPNN